jgi:hypothetical protein
MHLHGQVKVFVEMNHLPSILMLENRVQHEALSGNQFFVIGLGVPLQGEGRTISRTRSRSSDSSLSGVIHSNRMWQGGVKSSNQLSSATPGSKQPYMYARVALRPHVLTEDRTLAGWQRGVPVLAMRQTLSDCFKKRRDAGRFHSVIINLVANCPKGRLKAKCFY